MSGFDEIDELSENSEIIFDKKNGIHKVGEFTGSILTLIIGEIDTLIFSDNVIIDEREFSIKGLHIGIKDHHAYSEEKSTKFLYDMSRIDYCVKLDPQIVHEFDSARLSAGYPNIVRFLHTACLYLNDDNHPIDHLEFVANEILNRPVAITTNNGIIIGDRVVVDEDLQPIFYDFIYVERNDENKIEASYEPFRMVPISEISSIVLLGVENF